MLDSIDHPIENLLIIDNGGELAGLQTNSFIKKLTILPMLSNLGVSSSWNFGVKSFYRNDVFYFASADMWFAKGDLEKLAKAKPNEITLHRQFPYWQAFAIGAQVVEQIGLFDEALHPIYFEDNDYVRRASAAGITITTADLEGGHDNSSTIHSDNYYAGRNSLSFADNQSYYQNKIARGDFSPGHWDLARTRRNSWAR